MSYKNYTKLTLTIVFAIILLSFMVEWLHFNFKPTEGDLTRIGMHSESDYGNKGMEYYFDPVLSTKSSLDNLDDYDIVVIGDSFSTSRFSRAWHQYLQREIGINIGVIDISNYSLNDIIDSRAYKEKPPKIIIYESVERNLPKNLRETLRSHSRLSKEQCQKLPITPVKTLLKMNPVMVEPYAINQNDSFSLEIDRGIRYLKNLFTRTKKTRTLSLSTGELFTNNRSDKLLIYSDDIKKKKDLSLSDWRMVRCDLLMLQQKVQDNGKTKFIALIGPDKLTTYSSYLTSESWRNISQYQYLTKDHRLNIVPLLSYFNSAHKENIKDIYLPNDTHWSSIGDKLVGYAILDYLKQNRVIY